MMPLISLNVSMMVEIVVQIPTLEMAIVMITVIHLCVTMMVEIVVDHV